VLGISAVTGAGLADLVRQAVERLAEVQERDGPPPERVIPPHERDEILL
jgi:hypothetical protein